MIEKEITMLSMMQANLNRPGTTEQMIYTGANQVD
jgi:hypothetical protein